MGAPGLLPRRWRDGDTSVALLEAIAGILETPPITPSESGPAIFAELGTKQVLPLLLAAKSLFRQLGRGRFLLCGEHSLTGADRAILAHHLGDPQFLPAEGSGFPAGLPWHALIAALGARRGEYCLVLSPGTVTLGALPQVEQAMAANRSLASTALPGALLGFSAGGPTAPEPERFVAALGEDRLAVAQQRLLMAREIAPVSLGDDCALVDGGDLATSCAAIAALG
ncbi:hypothetical protein [Tsuneonella sp. HG222]